MRKKKGASVTVSFPIIFSAMSQSVLVEHNLYSDLRYHGFKMKNSGSILISCYVHVQQEKKTYRACYTLFTSSKFR